MSMASSPKLNYNSTLKYEVLDFLHEVILV